MLRKAFSRAAFALLILMPAVSGSAGTGNTESPESLVDKPYVDILRNPPRTTFSQQQLDAVKQQIESERNRERAELRAEEKALGRRIKAEQKKLDDLEKQESPDRISDRMRLRCSLDALQDQMNKLREQDHTLSLACDNKLAKLELLQVWPARERDIEQNMSTEAVARRRFGNVRDIGVRVIADGQDKDIQLGENAIQVMSQSGSMPQELNDPAVSSYVDKVAQRIAANSDVRVPIRVTVLDSDEANAFALPGGFLFVNRGLIEKTDNESELAGVIAHELAHVAARHGARLMRRAQIANLLYEGAQVAAVMLTGGAATVGTYYALQYGFYGLGLGIDLALLGVSRGYESQADQLGVQYAWKAGYDPLGFTTLFDKLAGTDGYIRVASFFRTHPPFLSRILATFSEIEYLPPKDQLEVDSSEFHEVQDKLLATKIGLQLHVTHRPLLTRGPVCSPDVH